MKRAGAIRNDDLAWWEWLLPLTGLTLLIYANSLSNGFVFDDVPLIQDNQQIRSLREVGAIFGRQGYRPVRTLTYALNYGLFGLQPFYFHLTNVLLHAANGVLVFLLLRRLLSGPRRALVGSLVFVSHPAQTAAVAYVSGRKDLLACGFIVAGLLCFGAFRESRWKWAFAASMACFALALFSKEVAVVFPLLLFAWDFVSERADANVAGFHRPWARIGQVFWAHRWQIGRAHV